MMRDMMIAVRVAAELLDLPWRHIAIAPTRFLALVPSGRALFVAIAIAVVIVAVMIPIGVVVAIFITIMGFVFVFVLLVAATMAVTMATFGVGAGSQGHAKDQREQKLHNLGSHRGTLLPVKSQIVCHSGRFSSYQGESHVSI